MAGLLLENAAGDQVLVFGPNLAEDGGTFDVPGWWRYRIEGWARSCDLVIRAIVHSHVTSLEASHEDRRAMAVSGLPWVIVRLAGERLEWETYAG